VMGGRLDRPLVQPVGADVEDPRLMMINPHENVTIPNDSGSS
jgi:hypothetical protein